MRGVSVIALLAACAVALVRAGVRKDDTEFRIYDLDALNLDKVTEAQRKPLDLSEVDDETYWLRAGTVRRLLELEQPKTVQIPVPVNILLVGFNGGGHGGLKLAEEDLRPWLEHVEHTVRHTVTGPLRGGEHVIPFVQYKYHFNVVELGEAVTDVIERAILHHMRPEDPHVDGYFNVADAKLHPTPRNATFQVDPAKISHVLEHLVHSFQFNHSYSIVLMNPKRHLVDGHGGVYGYRAGYSDTEIGMLRRDHTRLLSKKAGFEPDHEPRYFDTGFKPLGPEAISDDSKERYMHEHPDLYEPMQWKKYVDKAEAWAREYLAGWKQRPLHVSEYPAEYKQLHFSGLEGLEAMLQQVLHRGSAHDFDHLHEVQANQHLHEDCLVDAWVSHTRTAFIDMTAGPFNWGPVVAGEGVRTTASLPSVDAMHESLARAGAAHARAAGDVVTSQEDRYEQLIGERELLLEEFERACWDHDADVMKESEACNILLNDIDSRDQALERIRDGELHLLGSVLGDDEARATAEELSRASFLSSIGASLSTTLRQLVTPSSSTLPTYAERVSFHVFVVRNHDDYNPDRSFNFHDYRREVSKLRLPHQQFKFTMHHVSMSADESLAMAFESSLRSTVVPTLRVGGKFVPTKRLHVDSKTLRARLLGLGGDHFASGAGGSSPFEGIEDGAVRSGSSKEALRGAVRHVPVFVFSTHYPLPLFIDKYSTAKAVGGLVLVVQSKMRDWESHLACNGKPIFWNMRSPLRSAIAATMEELGGIGPVHVSYSEAHSRTADNWMWSVGETPLSATSSRYNVSLYQRDTVHRNYIVTAAYRMFVRVERALKSLDEQRTTSDNFEAIPEIPFKEIRREFWNIDDMTRDMIRAAGDLDFANAVRMIDPLEEALTAFEKAVAASAKAMEEHRCPRPKRDSSSMAIIWSVSAVCALGGAFAAYRARDRKIKIN